ncbi:hypothetical protein VTN02DRAFT_2854 [Thermoascus thermophilus]
MAGPWSISHGRGSGGQIHIPPGYSWETGISGSFDINAFDTFCHLMLCSKSAVPLTCSIRAPGQGLVPRRHDKFKKGTYSIATHPVAVAIAICAGFV